MVESNCQTIKQCAVVYSTIKSLLGEHIPENSEPRKVVLQMLHSCTTTSNKENILQSFQKEQGYDHILVTTIAFGMGLDCKEVYRTVHFGPTKNVEYYMRESGRAGRDGNIALLTFYTVNQGMQLMHIEADMKEDVKHKDFTRKFLLRYFDKEHLQPTTQSNTLALRQLLCNVQVWSRKLQGFELSRMFGAFW